MNAYKKFIKNTAIFGISNFASKILIFLLLPLYTRTMSSSDLGESDLIISLVSFLIPIFSLCVYEGVLRFGMDKKFNRSQVFTYGLYVIFGGFIVLLLCYPILKKFLGHHTILFYLIYLFACFNQYFNQFVRALEKIKLLGVVGIIGTLVLISSNIGLLYYRKMGLEGYLISYLLMNFIVSLLLFVFGRLYRYMTIGKLELSLQQAVLSYNSPLIPNKVNWWMISISNRFILGYFWGTNLVGLYSAANKLPSIITTIYGIVQQALLLSVIEEQEKQEDKLYKQINKMMGFLLAIAVVFISIGSTVGANLLFGKKFYDAWRLVPLLVLSAYFGSMHGNLTTLYMANKNTKVLFYNSILGMICALAFNTILIRYKGVYGAVMAMGLTYFCVWLHLYLVSKRDMEDFSNKWSVTGLLTIQAIAALFMARETFCDLSVVTLILILFLNVKELYKAFVLIMKMKKHLYS